jgi:hypothetical protein
MERESLTLSRSQSSSQTSPTGLRPPLVPHGVISSPDEAINTVRSPGDGSRLARKDAAQVFPIMPGAIPPLVPQSIVLPSDEAV